MNRTVDLCRDCHRAVHRLVPSEKELGRIGYTLDMLKAIPPIANYVAWARRRLR